jgi:pimeloyl-ACP methyl ester carboxylesterase
VEEPCFPGAVAPERSAFVPSAGLRLAVYEWGDPAGAPLVLCHGMFDHARGFDLLAPHLARRFRVVAFDARGHGESDWADAYLWPADVRDVVAVLSWVGRPAHLLGHSRGGGLATDAAVQSPQQVRQLVNVDGFGPPQEGFEPPGRASETPDGLPERLAGFLDRRRRAGRRDAWRPSASLEELVERRHAQNPRLSRDWLRYLCFHAARHTEAGWTWKADPLCGRGFGPWRPEWIAPGWRQLRAPMLAVTGSEPDTWGPLPEPLLQERLAYVPDATRATVEGVGHFVHMEAPGALAELLLDFLEA